LRHTIQPVDIDAVHQQRIALRPIIAIERERTLYRESRVDDTAISLAEKIVDTEIENVYSTLKQQNISQSHNGKFR
jgi:ribosomal protein S7